MTSNDSNLCNKVSNRFSQDDDAGMVLTMFIDVGAILDDSTFPQIDIIPILQEWSVWLQIRLGSYAEIAGERFSK